MPFQFYCPQGHLLEGHESQMGQQSQCPMCGSVFVVPMMPGGTVPGGMMPQGPMPGQMPPAGWPAYGPAAMPGYGQAMPPGYSPMYPPASYPGPAPGYPGAGPVMPAWPAPGYGPPSPEQPFVAGPFAPAAGPAAPAFPAEPAHDFPTIQTEPPAQSAAPEPAPSPAEQPPAAEEPKEPRIVRIPCPQGHELQTPTDMLDQEVLCPICGTQFRLRYEDSLEFKEEQTERRRHRAEQLNQAALKWSITAAVVVVLGILGMILYHVVGGPSEPDFLPPAEPATEVPAAPRGDADDKADAAGTEGNAEQER
ncbi:MAG TPA: hypothetical protein VNH11_20655 [Pirellulales bacterium]|nr:hypothetical protein [Pirellulales bacterium]